MSAFFTTRLAATATAAVLVCGCAADGSGMTETGQGASLGGAAGALAGALIGSLSADAGKGALIGAVGGALAGGMVGAYMEEQRRDFERALGPEIARGMIRVQALPNDELLVSMTGATTFEVDSDRIKTGFYGTLDTISAIIRRYGKTQLIIQGHTDDTGTAAYNQQLSEARADAVARYLIGRGVLPQRIRALGYGEERPIASNATERGRRLNRRVDLLIVPLVAS